MSKPTVRCPQGHENPAGQHFCGSCGTSLDGLCPNGHSNPTGQSFCGQCGAPLGVLTEPQEAPALDAGGTGPGHPVDSVEPTPKTPESSRPAGFNSEGGDPIYIGATATLRDGMQATVARIAAHDIWLDVVEENGHSLGRLRFPRRDVEDAFLGEQAPSPRRKVKHVENETPIRVGTALTLRAGYHATVAKVSGNDVWLDVSQDGKGLGKFKFAYHDVQAALVEDLDNDSAQQAAPATAVSTPPLPPQAPEHQTVPPQPSDSYQPRGVTAIGSGIGGVGSRISAWWRGLSPKMKYGIAGGSAALLIVGLFLSLAGGGSGGTFGSSTVDDWVASVCKAGTYSNHGGGLQNAQASGFCMSPRQMPIMIGQYDSKFSAQSDAAMVPGATYAMLDQSDGGICMFLAVSAGSGDILRPLSKFGATFGTS